MYLKKFGLAATLCGFAMIGGAYAAKPWNLPFTIAMAVALHMPIISRVGKVFSPDEVNWPVGATIRIDNDDTVPHTLRVTALDGQKQDFGLQMPGVATDITLDKLGDYMARRNIHPNMKLLIHAH